MTFFNFIGVTKAFAQLSMKVEELEGRVNELEDAQEASRQTKKVLGDKPKAKPTKKED